MSTSSRATLSERKKEAARVAEQHYDSDYLKMLQKGDAGIEHRRTYLFKPYIEPQHSVLDFGCGPGSLLDTLIAKRKCGVEITEASREVAAGRGIDVRPGLDDFEGETFDRIISSHCLEHVLDPAETLMAIRQHLAADGLFILLLPMNEWGHRPQRTYDPDEINKHLFTWTPLVFGNLLTVCGYEVQDVRAVHFWHPPKVGRLLMKVPPLYRAVGGVYSRLVPRRQVLAVCGRGQAD